MVNFAHLGINLKTTVAFEPPLPMWTRLIPLLLLTAALPSFARENGESWMEIRSPNFVVLTDASEKQGRHIAGQLERMREVFHSAFPKASFDASSPIVVLAVKDKKGFQALEPESYLAKGQLDLAGLFLRTPEKNYVLLRLDAQGEHPYATVYHEYTHFLMGNAAEWLPLWVNEGLAEFFQNTDIHEKEVDLGQPSPDDILFLRQNRLLPLETLFAVDAKSPYYHEEQKATVFYSESWALIDLLEFSDRAARVHRLADYVDMVSKHVDPVVAGERAFGDLGQLMKVLDAYVSHGNYQYFRVQASVAVEEASFQATALSLPQADAARADFLACSGRGKEARALLETVLRDDPKNVAARETMGYLEFRDGNMEAARKWYEEAVQLDSQSYVAHYYFAAISMRGSSEPVKPEDIEASFRAAIKLNPKFAPAYDQLASFYAMHHEKLGDAHMLNLEAVQLDRSNLAYRLNAASVLQEADRDKDALNVLRGSQKLARTPEESASVDARIKELEQYLAQRQQSDAARDQARPPYQANATTVLAPPKHPTEEPRGPRLIAKGIIKSVQCTDPSIIELRVEDAGKGVSLYSNNYYKITYSATNYTPEGEIHPCADLEGMKASIQYAATSDKTIDGQILSVQLSK
jgi:tetratricopeptide (TPR) repeat protein